MVHLSIRGPLYGIRNSPTEYWLITPPTTYVADPLMSFSPRIRPAIVMVPVPLSSFESVEGEMIVEQEVWPVAAMAIVTLLLCTPPPVTVIGAKQSAAAFAGTMKLTCHSPG